MTVDLGGVLHDHGPARTLGDTLRHTRIAAGASLEQVEADLRIKAKYIEAIEDGDTAALPSRAYTDGFLRNYATYLGLDPAETVRRFSGETGGASTAAPQRPAPMPLQRKAPAGLSGFGAPPHKRSAIGSLGRGMVALWPVALFAGLAFGGYTGFVAARDAGLIPGDLIALASSSPTEAGSVGEAPDVAVTADAPSAPGAETQVVVDTTDTSPAVQMAALIVGAQTPPGFTRPDALSYAGSAAVPYWQAKAPAVEPSDGPVSDIRPETAGLLRDTRDNTASRWSSSGVGSDTANAPTDVDASRIAAEAREVLSALGQSFAGEPAETADVTSPDDDDIGGAEPTADAAVDLTAPVVAAEPQPARAFALYASADTWVQVQDAIGTVTYTGILSAGEVYTIPDREGLRLKTGNAGGLYIEVDGQRFGPLGSDGAVMRNVVLDPGAVRASFTLSRAASLTPQ